mmetsp:Transcript_34982/g.82931  ORF Transcript_34982/g.82931 Transcript_34982/m.82931 type:complete len:225 (-) Transcript_34982:499-1173(-)
MCQGPSDGLWALGTIFSDGLWALGQREVVERVLSEDAHVVPSNRRDAAAGVLLGLVLDRAQVLRSCVVGVQDEELDLGGLCVVVHAEDRECQHPPPDANRRPLGVEVLRELSALVFEVVPRRHVDHLAGDTEVLIEQNGRLHRPNPLFGANEAGRFIAHRDQHLLHSFVALDRQGSVVLVAEPRNDSLVRAVHTPPPVVVEFVLHVVAVVVGPLHEVHAAALHP